MHKHLAFLLIYCSIENFLTHQKFPNNHTRIAAEGFLCRVRRHWSVWENRSTNPDPEAYVERVFSVCGELTTGKRNRLTKNLETRTFLKINRKFYQWTLNNELLPFIKCIFNSFVKLCLSLLETCIICVRYYEKLRSFKNLFKTETETEKWKTETETEK